MESKLEGTEKDEAEWEREVKEKDRLANAAKTRKKLNGIPLPVFL
jgi:hypothetical protein